MADNVQKLPLGRTLQEHTRRKILEHVQNFSGRAPATLMQATDKTNTIWMIKFDTDSTYTLPQITVPVHGSEYQRVPYQQGAKGYVATADMAISAMTGLGSTNGPASFTRGANLADLLWHPVGNTNFQNALDPQAHETYGASSGTITHDGTAKSLVKTHATNGTSVSSGGDGSGTPGPHVMTTHPQNGTSIATTVAHVLGAPNATLDKEGNQTNQGTHTAEGTITSTSGNVEAPAGSMMAGVAMSAPSGSFASGAIGGLKMLGGILSSGGGSSGSPSLTVAPEEVSAATLRTNVTYTVANLNAELPPSAGMAGVRAVVTDATSNVMYTPSNGGAAVATVQFLSVLQGGGSISCGAICLDTSGVGTDYQWCAG